jgi:hypothetical protein
VTGTVANCIAKATVTCEATINCRFARSWSASGNVLTLASDCSDGTSRDVRLSFTRDPQTGAFGNVTLLTVGGETGWSHNDFLWRFRKCPGTDEEQCASLH